MAKLQEHLNPFGADDPLEAHEMFQNLFRLPTSFESDDARRKRLLHILLVIFIGLAGVMIALTFALQACQCLAPQQTLPAFALAAFTILLNIILLFANGSPKVPGWLGAGIFVGFQVLLLLLWGDVPASGLIFWLLPMILAALLLRPSAGFIVAGMASALIFVYAPQPGAATLRYYAIPVLLMLALLCWLVMTLLNKSIRDARRQAANIEAILNTVTDGVLLLDLQGNYVSANRALLKMIPEDKLKEINTKPLEETLQWKHTVFSVTAALIQDAGSVVVFRDETRRHETERAKDALLATTSHELRTPLGSVMNYIELLLMMTDMGKVDMRKFKEHLTRAHQNSRRLLGVINNIIDQAQLQSGALDLKNERCNLPALLEKNRQLLGSQIKEKNLAYTVTIASNVPDEIMSDSERLHQVVYNLLDNAVKFTGRGAVTVTLSCPRSDTLTIEVTDTGPGIPNEQLPDIFEVFRRSSNYAQREHQGAGLGLSIVRAIVSMMGGQIAVSSTLGLGSVFTISIPLILPPAEEA